VQIAVVKELLLRKQELGYRKQIARQLLTPIRQGHL